MNCLIIKIRFYFIADREELSVPTNIFAMFERNMNVVKNFLERVRIEVCSSENRGRAIDGGQSLSEAKPKFIGIKGEK